LHQDLENGAFVLAGKFRGLGGEFLQRLLLAIDLQRRNDRIGRHETGERHGTFPKLQKVETSECQDFGRLRLEKVETRGRRAGEAIAKGVGP
jgi:hypothetical protein